MFWFSGDGTWAQQLIPVRVLWQLENRVNHRGQLLDTLVYPGETLLKTRYFFLFQEIRNSVFECRFFLLAHVHQRQ